MYVEAVNMMMMEKNISILKTIPRLFHYSKSMSLKYSRHILEMTRRRIMCRSMIKLLGSYDSNKKQWRKKVSQCVQALALEELNLTDKDKEPKTVLIAKEM